MDTQTSVVVVGAAIFERDPRQEPVAPTYTFGAQFEISADAQIVALDNRDTERRWLAVQLEVTPTRRTVLVVEDSQSNMEYYCSVLASHGCAVHRATTGAEAVAIAEEHEIELAFVDVRLPDANGFEVARRLNAADRALDFDIILMSVDKNLADPASVAASGASQFLVNPVSPNELSEVLAERLPIVNLSAVPEERPVGRPNTERVRATHADLTFFANPSVAVGSRSTPLPAGRSTEILGMLAAAAPAAVDAERLAKYAWRGDSRPSSNAIYTAVSRLRQFLTNAGALDVVQSTESGYRLDLDHCRVDLLTFEAAADAAIRQSEQADAQTVEEVLAMWSSPPPFAHSQNETLVRWSHRLAERRSTLVEHLITLLLDSGSPAAVVPVAEGLLDEEPWREATWAALVIGLYRAGRQSDALQALRAGAARLRNELGLEPGPLLNQLEILILTHDPALATTSINNLQQQALAGER